MPASSAALPSPRIPWPRQLLGAGVYLPAMLVFSLSYWIYRYVGKPDIGQIADYLDFGVNGIMASDPALVRRFLRWCVVAPLLFLAALLLADHKIRARIRQNPRLLDRQHGKLPPVLLVAATVYWLIQVSAFEYAASNFGPDYFVAHYMQAASIKPGEQQPRKLFLIYVARVKAGDSTDAAFRRAGQRLPSLLSAPKNN